MHIISKYSFSNIQTKLKKYYLKEDNSNFYFNQIKNFISSRENVELSSYRDKYLHRRLYNLIEKLKLGTYKAYLEYIRKNHHYTKDFIDNLTIHVTQFFRDEKPFRYIEEVLFKKIADSKKHLEDKTIRILSAACSSGEEPYSFAIIADYLQKKKNHINSRTNTWN